MNTTLQNTSESAFEYDCAQCGTRLQIKASERCSLVECSACGVTHPAPDFDLNYREAERTASHPDYTCPCPSCNADQAIDGDTARQARPCEKCGHDFVPATPPWQCWHRPVAKPLSSNDDRDDLDTIITGGKWLEPDEASRLLDEAELVTGPDRFHPFDFYCGRCGHVLTGVATFIARTLRCRHCEGIVLVPAPRRPHPAFKLEVSTNPESESLITLFCPDCGAPLRAEESRFREEVRCPACEHRFSLSGRRRNID